MGTKIDIDKLTESELVELNHRIVARLRFLNHMRAHAEMLDFRIGERVAFQPDGHPPVVGVLSPATTRRPSRSSRTVDSGGTCLQRSCAGRRSVARRMTDY